MRRADGLDSAMQPSLHWEESRWIERLFSHVCKNKALPQRPEGMTGRETGNRGREENLLCDVSLQTPTADTHRGVCQTLNGTRKEC